MFILGDVHAEKALMTSFLESSEKYCLQLGDFGFIWKYNDWKWNKFLNHFEANYPNKIIFTVLGNHENYDSFKRMNRVTVNGARCYKIRKNVFGVMRGEILSIEGYNILCVGGADSVDKDLRQPGETWWKEERIEESDIEKAILNSKNIKVDMVATHCAPIFIAYRHNWTLGTCSESLLEKLFYVLCQEDKNPPLWICGHYHMDLRDVVLGTEFKIYGIGSYEILTKNE